MAAREGQPMGSMIHIDEARIPDSQGGWCAAPDTEADGLWGADRCQPVEVRRDYPCPGLFVQPADGGRQCEGENAEAKRR